MGDNTTYTSSDVSAKKAALKAKVQSLTPNDIGVAFTAIFRDTTNDGREVDMVLAQGCIDRYREEMIRRYVAIVPGDTIPDDPATDIQKATHFVNFNGQGLKEWILEQFYGPIPVNNTDFKLANGIYTDAILEEYFPGPGNEAERAKRRGRITTFIIPVEKDTTNMLIGRPAYDLGGLEP